MIRKFYAEYCPYGAHTMNEGDTLYAFDNQAERDVWVDNRADFWNALTSAEARRAYGAEAMRYAAHPGSIHAINHRVACMRGER